MESIDIWVIKKETNSKFIEWIFDIVANKRNSIDVDKYDYMTRDSYHLGLKDTYFDYRALIKESRVIANEICFPAKVTSRIFCYISSFAIKFMNYSKLGINSSRVFTTTDQQGLLK